MKGEQFSFKDNALDRIEYQNTNNKWIKIIGTDYYVQFANDLYEISFSEQKLVLRKSKQITKIDCDKQVLVIDSRYFCFEEKQYYNFKLNTDVEINVIKYEISEIFSQTQFGYDSEQMLWFIFNYKQNAFVMMTDKSLFIIEYEKIKIINNRLTINDPKNEIGVEENCFFTICETNKKLKLPSIIEEHYSISDTFLIVTFLLLLLIVIGLSVTGRTGARKNNALKSGK